jgi:hypothetical protein
MKEFHELNKEQKKSAIHYAKSELEACIRLGLIVVPKSVSVDGLVQDIAEESDYRDDGTVIRMERA